MAGFSTELCRAFAEEAPAPADPTVITATAGEVRVWAAKKGLSVGTRGHLPVEVIGAFNRAHRRRQFTNRNPWLGGQS